MKNLYMVLIRGLPGSAKSTLASFIDDFVHIETDMFWGKNYNFDITKIKEAHEWCQNNTTFWLDRISENKCTKYKGVCVTNTFTTKEELKPYFEIAKKFGIIPMVLISQNNFGNVHNVPEDIIEKMKSRFEYDISELFERFI